MLTTLKRGIINVLPGLLLGVLLVASGCTPSGPKSLLQGEQLLKAGRAQEAVDKFLRATELLPNEARAWNFLGLAHQHAGNFGEALRAYDRALNLDRNLDVVHFNRGVLMLEQGNAITAVDELRVFTGLQPRRIEGWLRLGDALMDAGQLQPAGRAYAQALQIDPVNAEAYNGLGLIKQREKDPRMAYRYFAEAFKNDPAFAAAQLNMAVIAHRELNVKPSALQIYERYLEEHPNAHNYDEVDAVYRALHAELNPQPEPRPTAVADRAPSTSTAASATRGETSVVAQSETRPAARTNAAPATVNRRTNAEAAIATSPRPATNTAPIARNPVNTPQSPAPARTERPPVESPVTRLASQSASNSVAAATNVTASTNTRPDEATSVAEQVGNDRPATNAAEVAVTSVPTTGPGASERAPAELSQTTSPDSTPTPSTTNTAGATATTAPPTEPEPEPVIEEAEEEEEPMEVAVVSTGPAIRPAEDVTPPEIQTSGNATQETTDAQATADQPVEAPSSGTAAAAAEPEQEERGFFSRLNPANLFRRERDSGITPLPGDDEAAATQPAERTEVALNSAPQSTSAAGGLQANPPGRERQNSAASTPPAEPRPVYSRYTYRLNAAPPRGDREAAQEAYAQAINARRSGRSAEAIGYFSRAAELDRSWYSAQYNAGMQAFQSADWPTALSSFEAAAMIDPDSASARFMFANALQKANYPNDARDQLERLLESDPDNVQAHLLLANVLAQDLKETAAATVAYQKVLELNPQHSQATAIRYWLKENAR